jgi:hypothetical protein
MLNLKKKINHNNLFILHRVKKRKRRSETTLTI